MRTLITLLILLIVTPAQATVWWDTDFEFVTSLPSSEQETVVLGEDATTIPTEQTTESATPADPQATSTAIALLNSFYLAPSLSSHRLLSGQYVGDVQASLYDSAIVTDTGQRTGLVGDSYYNYRGMNMVDAVNTEVISLAQAGAVIQIDIITPNPSNGHQAIDMAAFNFPDLYTPGNAIYNTFHSYLDEVARGLLVLQSQNIPVLFRPFMEANGNWFWWSNGTDAQFITLWQHTFNYLVTVKSVHNALWVYAAAECYTDCLTKYPGDAFVDIVGMDSYAIHGLWGPVSGYALLTSVGKPFAITEFGLNDSEFADHSVYDLSYEVNNIVTNMPLAVYWMNWSCMNTTFGSETGWCIQRDANNAAALANYQVRNRSSTTDTTPPTQVAGVVVQGTTSTTATVTSAGATDVGSGITSYRYELCAGLNCSNFSLWHVFPSSPLTVTLTGLTANTIYQGRVNAQDNAGNVGAYSVTFTFTTPAPATRNTRATDTFTQADENPLSSSGAWLGGYTNVWDCLGVMGHLKVVGHVVENAAVGDCSTMQYAAVAPPPDQWAQFTLGTFNAHFHEGGTGLRVSVPPAQITGYFCHAYANPNFLGLTAIIFKNVNRAPGSATIAQTNAVTWVTGDVGRCEVQGTTISFFKNDVLILSGTDTEFTSGKTSMDIYIDAEGSPALTDMTITGFAMGDFITTSATSRRVLGTESFNIANENPLSDGGHWTGGYTGLTSLQVVSNMVEGTTAAGLIRHLLEQHFKGKKAA